MRAKSGASSSFCLLFLAFAFSIFDSLFEFLASSRASAHFFAHFAPQHEHDHLLVGPPGPQRMLERCRAVVLDEKVRDPRQRVRNHKRCIARAAISSAHPVSVPARCTARVPGWLCARTYSGQKLAKLGSVVMAEENGK